MALKSKKGGRARGIAKVTRQSRVHRKVGVYWGRFNPPHKGHMRVIRRLKEQCDLIVAVGSSEHKNEKKNPFSGAERKQMIESYLRELKMGGVRVVTLVDGRSFKWAIDNMMKRCNPDVLFLSSEKSRLADMAKRRVRVIFFKRTGDISSTLIRDRIAAGDDSWKRLTGKSVAELIQRWDGLERIRKAYVRR